MKKDPKTIAVNSVELEIAGTKLTLTMDQVAELKKMLAKAFPEPETKVVFTPGPERIVERYRPFPMMRLASPLHPSPPMMWHSTEPHPLDEWKTYCQARVHALDCASAISQ